MANTVMISVEKNIKFSKNIPVDEKMETHMEWLEEEIMDHLENLPIEIDYEVDDPDSEDEDLGVMVVELAKMGE